MNNFCASFSSKSVYCITSSGEDNDIDNEDTSKTVEVDIPLFVRPSLVELSLKAAQSHNVMDHDDDDSRHEDDDSCADFCRETINDDNGDNSSCLSSEGLHANDNSMSADDDDDELGDEDDNDNDAPPKKDRNELTISFTSTSY